MSWWDSVSNTVQGAAIGWQIGGPVGAIVGGTVGTFLTAYEIFTSSVVPKPIPPAPPGAQLPQTQEGTPIPILYGRWRISAPILGWNSQTQWTANDNSNNGSGGTTFSVDMMFILGVPMGSGITRANKLASNAPRLYKVWYGDKPITPPVMGCLPAQADKDVFTAQLVYAPDFLGGHGQGGGLIGIYNFTGGYTDQLLGIDIKNSMQSLNGGLISATQIPGYRQQMTVSFTANNYTIVIEDTDKGFAISYLPTYLGIGQSNATQPLPGTGQGTFIIGESPNVAGFSFDVSSYGDLMWSMVNPGFDFGGDADPAQVIYDVLTNKWSRAGVDPSKIDTTSFAACSATLAAEAHGYSMLVTSTTSAAQIIGNVLAQIGGTLYEEPTTGLLTLALIRFDYNPATIPAFDETNTIEVGDYSMSGWTNIVNEVRVSYTDRKNDYKPGIAIAQSLGVASVNSNRRNAKTISYPGITNATLAAQIAARDLNILGQPFARASFTFNRTAFRLRPGAVFKQTWAEYGISATVFRVIHVDLGQLEDNKVVVHAVQDAFTSTYAGSALPWSILPVASPYPIATRTIIEAPRWLAGQAAHSGLITDPDVSHLLPLLTAPTNGVSYSLKTKHRGIGIADNASTIYNQFLVDVPQTAFPTTFVLNGSYARELEPYDTTTGLVVNSVTGALAATFASLVAAHDDIANHGKNLFITVAANGEMEIMAFESVTDLGGGLFRLNNLWRGLLDTPAIAHVAGERGFMLDANLVGRRGWDITRPISEWIIPAATFQIGSGGDPIDSYQTVGRPACPLPPANQGIAGEAIYVPVLGLPSVAGQYKSAAWLEEGFDLYGTTRNRLSPTVRRGNEAADTLADFSATSYFPVASPSGIYGQGGGHTKVSGSPADTLAVYCDGANLPNGVTIAGCLGAGAWQVDGYGSVGLGLVASRFVNVGDPLNGIGGYNYNTTFVQWRTPLAHVYLPPWRNLLANVRFDYNAGSNAAWHDNSGVSAVGSGNFALNHSTSGKFLKTTASSTLNTGQLAGIINWSPIALTAVAVAYFRNANSDTNDTANLKIKCAHGTGLASSGASAPAIANWQRYTASLVVPSDAVFNSQCFIEAQAELVEVALGGGTSGVADGCADELELRLGQFATTNGLANYSFDSGTTASWTNDVNSFAVVAGSSGPSPDYAQGGSFSSSRIHQDYALPAGWEYGSDAFVVIFMGSTLANDTAKCTIAALDVSNTVLATSDTGAQSFAELSTWHKFTAYVACPDGTTKIRITLDATRTLGSGSSGAIFDEVVLWVTKALAPRTSYAFDFSAPKVQPTSRTWQEFTLAYPSLPVPDALFLGGSDFGGYEINWTDTATHPIGKIAGQFGAGTASINAYRFVRGTGSSAVHAAAFGPSRSTLCAFTAAQSFTVHAKIAVDEFGFATACGVVGRMDLTAGWGIEINASGQPVAILRGASGTKTATGARSVVDGCEHELTLVYDAIGQTLTIYDEQGASAATSTATGLGEIARTASTCHLRIGRDADDRDVLPGQVSRVYVTSQALSSGQVASLSTLGKDPTGLITTYTRTAVAVASGPSDGDGATAYYVGMAQVAIPYSPALAADGGTGYGLAVGKSASNLVASWDVATWSAFTSPTLTRGIVDHTGRARGINVVAPSSSDGVSIDLPLAATPATVMLTFWARLAAGTVIDVHLRNTSNVNKSTVTVTPTALNLWQRYDIQLTGWDGSTVNGRISWQSPAGATFDLGHTVCALQGADFPALLPLPASTHGDYSATAAITLPIQFNSEGELWAQGIGLTAPTPAVGSVVSVTNGVTNKNRRDLAVLSTAKFRSAVWDATTPTEVDADLATANIATEIWKARARWNRAQLLDTSIGATSTPFSSVVYEDQVSGGPTATTGRTAIFTLDTTQATTIKLGAGVAAPSDMLLRKVVVQTCQEKL